MDNQEEEIVSDTYNNTSNHDTKKLKHCHSVPIQQKRDTMIINPHTFRLSRSNINNVEERTCNDSTRSTTLSTPSTLSRTVQSWNVNDDDIKIFPPYLAMERTHCIIHGLSPYVIANNISTYLKGVAASTLYDDENAVAHAEFKHELRVLIRLFKKIHEQDNTSMSTRTNTSAFSTDGGGGRSCGKDNDCILVEVVRREGCSAQFHCEARRILHAAQGLDICTLDENDLSMKKVLNVPKELRREYLNQFKITDYTATSLT